MSEHTRLIQWFLDLVQIDTQSIPATDKHPSNPIELKAISYIQEALVHIAGCEVKQYDFGTLVLTIQATDGFEALPTIALAAHVDTAFSANGKVSPIIHDYTEGDIQLPHSNIVIPADSPSLIRLREFGGGRVITGDGTSLLGADDKAGVAALMELICRLEERSIPHPCLVFIFTTDEEIGEFGGDLPAELLESIDLLWTIDGITLGTIDTGCLKGILNKFIISGNHIAAKGTRQITIEFKGKGGHPGITPELFRPANSAAYDLLYTAIQHSESCMPISLGGNPSSASLVFAAGEEVDYYQLLQKVLIRHPEVTADLTETPLEDDQFSHTALKYVAAFGKMIFERCPVQTHRGKDGNGIIASQLVRPVEGNPDDYIIGSGVRDETSDGFKQMEDFFIGIETEIRDSLEDGIIMEKERNFICENIAYAISENRELLKPMNKAMIQNGLEPVERFISGGTDGGMLNINYPHLPCPNIGTGVEMLHCEQEHISIEDLETLADILTSYIEQVG